MHLRPFADTDRDTVIALWHATGVAVPWNDAGSDIDTYTASGQNLFVVAVDDAGDAVIGTAMAGFDGHRGWIYYLAVAADQRRHGVGRALVQHCETELERRGCPKVNLMVREGNSHAAAFYTALGYESSAVDTLGRRLD